MKRLSNWLRSKKAASDQGIEAPVGYDARVDGSRTSAIMQMYSTGGTPWTLVIDKKRKVVFSNFTPGDPDALADTRLLAPATR